MNINPSIRKHLLWEYNLEEVDFTKLAVVVVERVIERGNFDDWREIIRFYGKSKINSIAQKSTRLDKKNKNFTPLFLESAFVN